MLHTRAQRKLQRPQVHAQQPGARPAPGRDRQVLQPALAPHLQGHSAALTRLQGAPDQAPAMSPAWHSHWGLQASGL